MFQSATGRRGPRLPLLYGYQKVIIAGMNMPVTLSEDCVALDAVAPTGWAETFARHTQLAMRSGRRMQQRLGLNAQDARDAAGVYCAAFLAVIVFFG